MTLTKTVSQFNKKVFLFACYINLSYKRKAAKIYLEIVAYF
jgi:hypothetical protein